MVVLTWCYKETSTNSVWLDIDSSLIWRHTRMCLGIVCKIFVYYIFLTAIAFCYLSQDAKVSHALGKHTQLATPQYHQILLVNLWIQNPHLFCKKQHQIFLKSERILLLAIRSLLSIYEDFKPHIMTSQCFSGFPCFKPLKEYLPLYLISLFLISLNINLFIAVYSSIFQSRSSQTDSRHSSFVFNEDISRCFNSLLVE